MSYRGYEHNVRNGFVRLCKIIVFARLFLDNCLGNRKALRRAYDVRHIPKEGEDRYGRSRLRAHMQPW
ncbi:MAG: hypothetical protein BWY17_04809 [Deltaproteobacteria bacterium ADurb.Bin207]|jgi:hypothetical protein|nr:MAG: hypothetical protein BWY17_04809 [Deltaproteobacteria bacterium ADurb.Bin207]